VALRSGEQQGITLSAPFKDLLQAVTNSQLVRVLGPAMALERVTAIATGGAWADVSCHPGGLPVTDSIHPLR